MVSRRSCHYYNNWDSKFSCYNSNDIFTRGLVSLKTINATALVCLCTVLETAVEQLSEFFSDCGGVPDIEDMVTAGEKHRCVIYFCLGSASWFFKRFVLCPWKSSLFTHFFLFFLGYQPLP